MKAPLEDGKGERTDSPLELPHGRQLDVSQGF